MAIFQAIVSAVILGLLYYRMIIREKPTPISWLQALTPVGFGMASTMLSFYVLIGLSVLLNALNLTLGDVHPFVRSMYLGFLMAGGPEEITKFAFILITVFLFRKKIRNVYEYTLIGAAVGMGFTLPEEILYGSDLLGLLFRIDFIAGHMIFGILMTYFLGMAKYKKLTAQGSPTREYVLALLVPMLMHTLYDTFTANNKFLTDADENIQMIGAGMGIVVALAAFVIQIVILVKHKKNAEKLCSLRLS